MFPKGSQLEFGPARQAYYQGNQDVFGPKDQNQQSAAPDKPCPFCDTAIMATNYVLSEDTTRDVRIMMNKFPYPDFDQAVHCLCMPTSHKTHPDDFYPQELAHQADTIQQLSVYLHDRAHTQEHFTNWGRMAGQSVPHWHSQFKSFEKPPLSMPERMRWYEYRTISNSADAFKALQTRLEQQKNTPPSPCNVAYNNIHCLCCAVQKEYEYDNDNFVVARFDHNFMCLSHYPEIAGEISIIPNEHVSSLKDMQKEVWQENMVISTALLPIMKAYANTHIRECGGANTYTKSIGAQAEPRLQQQYHIHTRIMPRTTIAFTPGDIDSNSRKLDYNPTHLLAYLVPHIQTINEKLMLVNK